MTQLLFTPSAKAPKATCIWLRRNAAWPVCGSPTSATCLTFQGGSDAGLSRSRGKPLAVRAVGTAIGRNPIGVIVPCHRVVGADGSLTGYAGGLHRKEAFLTL